MLFDLNKLHGTREHVERTFQPSAFDPQDADYRVVAPAELVMDVQRIGDNSFGVSGRVRTRLQTDCSRCAEPFEIPVDATFDLGYVPHIHNAGEGELEVEDDDLAMACHREGLLDLVDLLREQFVLALPMKPLCREDCRGLCPQCGTNLNRSQCDCTPAWEDPRLTDLRSLLSRDKET